MSPSPRVRRRQEKKRWLYGLVTLLVLGALTYVGFTKPNPFKDTIQIDVAFENASDVKPRSPVRVAGIGVGKVTAVEGLPGGETGAMVSMEIDKRGLPIHSDATFKVRPRIFLEGNFFVDVQPGTPEAPELRDGATVPVTQTAAPVSFGQVLEALQSDTREDLQTFLQEYGAGLRGEGARGYNRSIRWWEPAYRDSATVNDATRGVLEHDLSNYIAGAAKVAQGLDRDPAQLKALVTDFSVTADAFADEQGALSATIRQLPITLQTGRRALTTLDAAFPPLRRLTRDFRPGVRSSGPALDATLPFLRQMRLLVSRPELRGLVRDLRPVVPDLTELNRGGIALQEQQRLLSSCNNLVVNPWQNEEVPDQQFGSAGPIYQEASRGFTGLAGESRSFDANGQYVRSLAKTANVAAVLPDGEFFMNDQPFQGLNPPPKQGPQSPYRPDVPCETQPGPDLRTVAAPAPPQRTIRQDMPGAAERRARADALARDWLEDNLEMSGLDASLSVSPEPLLRSELDDVVRTLGPEAR